MSQLLARVRPYARWIAFGLGVLALAVLIYRTAPDRANPTTWGRSEWTSTGLLVLILVSVWCLGGYLKAVSSHLDQAWDEVDELRGEVGSLRVEVEEVRSVAKPKTSVFPASPVEEPETTEIEVVAVGTDTGPIVVQSPADIPESFPGVPTTVTGIPSARPGVPGAVRPSPRPRSAGLPPLLEEEPRRGRHAANE